MKFQVDSKCIVEFIAKKSSHTQQKYQYPIKRILISPLVKEFSSERKPSRSTRIDVKFVQFAIQVLWERSAKEVAGKGGDKEENDKSKLRPNAVVHIGEKLEANIYRYEKNLLL